VFSVGTAVANFVVELVDFCVVFAGSVIGTTGGLENDWETSTTDRKLGELFVRRGISYA